MSSTRRSNVRIAQDKYYSPLWTVEKLIELIDFSKIDSFHEPCLGGGNIFNLIPVENKTWCEIDKGIDYLTADVYECDLIITNPPYRLAREFIEKALTHGKTVIMLLRLNFLESQSRYEFWQANPPSHIIVLSKRPSFTGKGTDSTAYAWFAWNGAGVIQGHALQWIKESV